jgi:hypothetical protein
MNQTNNMPLCVSACFVLCACVCVWTREISTFACDTSWYMPIVMPWISIWMTATRVQWLPTWPSKKERLSVQWWWPRVSSQLTLIITGIHKLKGTYWMQHISLHNNKLWKNKCYNIFSNNIYTNPAGFFSSSSLPAWSVGLISQFLDHSQTVGLLGWVISSSQGLYLNTGQHKHRKTHTHTSNIHSLTGIRTHDPGLRASEDSTCPRPLGYRKMNY